MLKLRYKDIEKLTRPISKTETESPKAFQQRKAQFPRASLMNPTTFKEELIPIFINCSKN